MTRKHRFPLGLGLAATLILLVGHPSPVRAAVSVTILPKLEQEWFFEGAVESTWANGINNAGVVVGEVRAFPRLSSEGEVVVWSDGAVEALPRLPAVPPGGANDVNSDGTIVGFSTFPPHSFSHATKWVGGVAIDLGVLPGYDSSAALAINDAGQIVGSQRAGQFFDAIRTPVRWSADDQVSILDLPPTQDPDLIDLGFTQHDRGFAVDINATGRAVGYTWVFGGDIPSERLPVVWDDTAVTTLPLPDGYNSGRAEGINDAGKIVGSIAVFEPSTFSFPVIRAAYWSDVSSEPELLPLPDGIEFSHAVAVNSHGQIIGFGSNEVGWDDLGSPTNMLLWNPDGSILDLTPYLNAAIPGAQFYFLTDINDRGQITGHTSSFGVAFVITIPEPASGGLLLIGLCLIAAVRGRRLTPIT